MEFDYYLPVRVKFGPGVIRSLGAEVKKIGRKAIIVTGKNSARQTGILDLVEKQLAAAGVAWVTFAEVMPNPLFTVADAGAELARREQCDLVIGLGGGSSLDTAKAVAVGAVNPGSVWEYVENKGVDNKYPTGALPQVMVITNAGTGSEINHSAVLTNPATGEKPSITSPFIYPKISFVDPQLMLSVPAKVTAESGLDILFQAIEGYVNKTANPISKMLAAEALKLVYANLATAYDDGSNLPARTNIALASVLGGMSNDQAASVLLHALEHPVSGFYNVPHGSGLAALFPAVFQFNLDFCLEELAQIYCLWVGNNSGMTRRQEAQGCIDLVSRLITAVGQSYRLRDFGVKEADFLPMAQHAFSTMGGGVANNPRPVSLADMMAIYGEAL